MDPFKRFLDGLRADHRLGRYIPSDYGVLTPETLVLSLTMRLADACEGNQPHPALVLLERMEAGK